jgi:hypothetical protein
MATAKKPSAKPFVGRWRITEMETWPQDYVDLDGPGHITIKAGRSGQFEFGAVIGFIDYRVENAADGARLEFSWDGEDETDPISGRGWVTIRGNELHGRLFIHNGDESGFIARKG